MKNALLIILISIFIFGKFTFAQGEANIWYFGQNAGLDFNGGAPVALTNGQVNTLEGCASISSSAGILLFYTDGITVWNKNHVPMPNGFGLMGDPSSTQSGVIIQKPGSAEIYYIFTVDYQANANGIRYSEVDITLNAGLGDVTSNKNILLNTPSCEKITGVRHCNNKDVWVVTHDWNSDAFRTYLVTSAGVNTIPVISNAGIVVSGSVFSTIGYLKGSPDGKKLASAIDDPTNRFELFDFNNSTGIVSNAILFPQLGGTPFAYGVEFSPDGTKMYGSTEGDNNIYQFNLCAGSNTAIANSGVLIGTAINSNDIGSLQLGTNNKIYLSRHMAWWLGVINNPNALGTACNYVNDGVLLGGKVAQIGLPNFVSYYFTQPLAPSFTVVVNCLTGIFTAPIVNVTNCSGSGSAITSVSWNFGDPSSANNTDTVNSPIHTFTSPGTYIVTLVLNYACGNDTIQQNVTVANCGLAITVISTNILCKGQCTGTGTANPTGGAPPYTYNWTSGQTTQTTTGLCAGTHTVIVMDADGSAIITTVIIANGFGPIANAGNNAILTLGNTITLTASGGGSYLWNTGDTTAPIAITPIVTTEYCVTVTDSNNCTDTACVTITVIVKPVDCSNTGELYLPNAFSPNDDGENDVLKIHYENPTCIKTFKLVIYDRWGEKVFKTTDPEKAWDGFYKGKVEGTAAFVYYIQATLLSGEEISKKGNISLIR